MNEENKNINLIYLDGYLCKPPIFRKTPLGRQITDLLIAVNRHNRKSDYIPCIVWGRTAQWVSKFEVGARVKMYGRIQSRMYFKKISPDSDEGEDRDAYEIYLFIMNKVESIEII